MDASLFAARLKELRESKRLTQQQLADLAGLKLGGIADLEQGRREPAWRTVLALAKALDVSCEAFTAPSVDRPPIRRGRPKKGSGVR